MEEESGIRILAQSRIEVEDSVDILYTSIAGARDSSSQTQTLLMMRRWRTI